MIRPPFHFISKLLFRGRNYSIPAYGLLMGVANLYRKLLIFGVTLAIVHSAFVAGSLYVANPYFLWPPSLNMAQHNRIVAREPDQRASHRQLACIAVSCGRVNRWADES